MTYDLTVNELDLPISNVPDSELAKLSDRSYLPYIKLVGTSSKEAEDGSVKPGTYLLYKDQSTKLDLTNSFEVMVVATRPLACRKTSSTTLRFYDMASADYKAVEIDAAKDGMTGTWFGPEFLVWVRSLKMWATFHASSATAQGRSANLVTILRQWASAKASKKQAISAADTDEARARAQAIIVPNPQATFRSTLISYAKINKKQWGPEFVPCTTPFSEVPSFEELREQAMKFVNPAKVEKETVAAGEGASDRG